MKQIANMIPVEAIISKIYFVLDQKVMVDHELADLYKVDTKRLKAAARRNINRFPADFMFELTVEEAKSLRTQFASSKPGKGGNRYMRMVFTEQGVSMLSSVLNSETAIRVNIQIIMVFTKMRELLLTHKDILTELEKIEKDLPDMIRALK